MARHKKTINIQSVARQAGVSVATVSRVINHHTDVSEELRRRIQAVMAEVNFTPTRGRERVSNIGVVVSTESPILAEYPARVIDGMTEYAGDKPIAVSIIMNYRPGDGKPLLRLIRERRCDAVALLMCDRIEDELAGLEKAGLPTMLVNKPCRGVKCGFVNNESYSGARQIIEYLLGLGHTAIGSVMAGMDQSDNHIRRHQAYLDAMAAAGLPVAPHMLAEHIPTTLGQEAGYRQALQLFRQYPEVTAVFAHNDELAMGALKACWDTGRRVPDDISVVGFDGLPISQFCYPALTTVRQPLARLGFLAIKYLDEFLKGEIDELPGETLETELVIRDSAAPPKRRNHETP